MGIVFRQSAKNSLISVLGAVLGAIIIWLSTKYTTKDQLGFTRNLTNYAITFSHVLLMGLSLTLVVYIHKYANDERKRKLLITLSILLPTIATLIFTVTYFILKEWILKHFQPGDAMFMRRYFVWIPVFTFFFVYMIILEQYLGSQLKVAAPAFMREVVLRVANIVLLLLFGFDYIDFDNLVIGIVLSYSVPVVIFFLISSRIKSFGFAFNLRNFQPNEYKEMAHFSWYHFLLVISILMIGCMDVLALPLYDHNGFKSVAVYGVAVFITSFMQLPSKAMTPASFTVLAKAFNDNEMDKAKDIFKRASINILIASTMVAILLCCNIDNAIAVIKNGYSEIAPVFFILFIGKLFDIATGMNDQVLSIAKYYKFNFYLSLLLMIILFLLLRTLIPMYGIYGAAWSTTTTIILFNFIKLLFVWKKLDMQPFSRNTLLVVVAALPALAAGYFFPHLLDQSRHTYVRTFADVCMRSTIIVIVYMLMLWWLKPSKDLQEYIASVKKNKRLF